MPISPSLPSAASARRSVRSVVSSPGAKLAVAGMVAAAATAAWVALRARQAERDHLPTGEFVDADGVHLHYEIHGSGPDVVLIHGNNASLADFDASGLMQRLARNHRVIAFDRPGYGHSNRPRDRLWTPAAQASALRSALMLLGIERPVVVGHSMGTLVALAMALDYPHAVQGLVLVGGYYYPRLRLDALAIAPVALPVLGDAMRYTVTALAGRALLNRQVEAMFAPMPVPANFLPTLSREMLLRPQQLRANAEDTAFMVPAAWSLSARYGELQLPVHLIAGAQDQVVDPEAHSARLHRDLPGSSLSLLPDTGHMAHYAARALLVSAVSDSAGQAAGTLAAFRPAIARAASSLKCNTSSSKVFHARPNQLSASAARGPNYHRQHAPARLQRAGHGPHAATLGFDHQSRAWAQHRG